MANIQKIKELREMTQAGMMDCKKALDASNDDINKAVIWLREKGISKAAKKASRIAAEGVCACTVDGNRCVVYELNCETDFVSSNATFQALVEQIGQALVDGKFTNDEDALNVEYEGTKVSDIIINATATIGEKISLRRISQLTKKDNQIFGSYSHMGGKIVTVVILDGDNENIAKDVCMHVAAMNPKYLGRDSIDADYIKNETEILRQEALNEGKPEKIVDKMVVGRLNKSLKEVCLLEQSFVKEPDLTVGQYVKNNKCAVVSFTRLMVGEGIEKKKCDLAAEVAEALK
ncbi:MAG: translation elongation factor Ts [Bacilli bacterium]